MTDFATIYRGNLWSGRETRSGPGSSRASTALLSNWLRATVERLGVRSVLDAGCGEGMWMPDLPGYIGVDLVPDAIETARYIHPDRAYFVIDVRHDDLPPVDLVVTRDFMQHVSVDDGVRILENLRGTGARWLIASTYRDGDNRSTLETHWDAYRVNLQVAPFNLGEPLEVVCDGYDEDGVLRDPPKGMGLWEW